ncbi:MAG: response regulator transcription factor [Firmicutes bacterium]|nr:response regulator transcription factor [Bacillota bacterium]
MLRGVIVEDNEYFRTKLLQIIHSFGGIDIEYCIDSGEELLEILKQEDINLVFLDIGLTGMSGIETAKLVRADYPNIEIIFVTSHEEYVRDAIQLYAADYITKPLNIARLKKTLERLKNRYLSNEKVIQFRSGYKTKLVKESEIYMAEAFDDKSKIYTDKRIFEANYTLKELEALLDRDIFVRTSRSYLVNVQKVSFIKTCSRKSFVVHFHGSDYIAYLTKTYYQEFRRRVKETNQTEFEGEGQ